MGRKEKITEWAIPNFEELNGFDEFITAKTTQEQRIIFGNLKSLNLVNKTTENDDESNTIVKKYPSNLYLRLLIDMTKKKVNTLDNTYFAELATTELKTIIEGFVRKNFKDMGSQAVTDDRANHVVNDLFVYVCSKFDPLSAKCTIATFVYNNQKRLFGKVISDESNYQTEATQKIDAQIKRIKSYLQEQGKDDESIINIKEAYKELKDIEENFTDDDATELTAATIRNSLNRIRFRQNQSSIYATQDNSMIDISVQSSCRDMKDPESLFLENERAGQILEAFEQIKADGNEEGLKMYLAATGFSFNEEDNDFMVVDIENEKINEVADRFDKTVAEAKRMMRRARNQLMQAIRTETSSTINMPWIERVLAENEVPFMKATQKDIDEFEDFDSIIEIEDF
jgi:hypothetical protein